MGPRLADDPTAYSGVLLPHWVAGLPVDLAPEHVIVDPRSGALVPVASTPEVEHHLDAITPALPRWLALKDADRRDAVLAISEAVHERRDELVDVVRFEFDLDHESALAQVRRSWERTADIVAERDARYERVAPGICAFVLSRHRRGKVLTASIARVLLNDSIVVVKPSLSTPLTTHLLTETICRAVLPGAVNLVHGDEETVDALVSSPVVSSICVDGSTAAELHVDQLGALFTKPVLRYAEDARFSRGDVPRDPRTPM